MATFALSGSPAPFVRGSAALAGLLALIAGLAFLGDPPARRPDPATAELLVLVRDRMAVMSDVAKWKWTHNKPVEDTGRHGAIQADVQAQARRAGLDAAFVEAFFAAQFAASIQVQTAEFRRWEAVKQRPFTRAPDLVTELRPRIDALNAALIAALSKRRPSAAEVREWADRIVVGHGVTPAVRATAIRPLLAE